MNDADLIQLCERHPETVDAMIAAMRHVIDVERTRGAMLRALSDPLPTRRPAGPRLVYSRNEH